MAIDKVDENGLFENISDDEQVNKQTLFCSEADSIISFDSVVQGLEAGFATVVQLFELLNADDMGEFFEAYNLEYENVIEFRDRMVNGAGSIVLCSAFKGIESDLNALFLETFGKTFDEVLIEIEEASDQVLEIYSEFNSDEVSLDNFENTLKAVGLDKNEIIDNFDTMLSDFIIEHFLKSLGDKTELEYIEDYGELNDELKKISFIDCGKDIKAFLGEVLEIIFTYFYEKDSSVIDETYRDNYKDTLTVAKGYIETVVEVEEDFDIWSIPSVLITKVKVLAVIDMLGKVRDDDITLQEISILYQFFTKDLIELLSTLDNHLYLIAFKKLAYPLNEELKLLDFYELRREFLNSNAGSEVTNITAKYATVRIGGNMNAWCGDYRGSYDGAYRGHDALDAYNYRRKGSIDSTIRSYVNVDLNLGKTINYGVSESTMYENVDEFVYSKIEAILIKYFKQSFYDIHEENFRKFVCKYAVKGDVTNFTHSYFSETKNVFKNHVFRKQDNLAFHNHDVTGFLIDESSTNGGWYGNNVSMTQKDWLSHINFSAEYFNHANAQIALHEANVSELVSFFDGLGVTVALIGEPVPRGLNLDDVGMLSMAHYDYTEYQHTYSRYNDSLIFQPKLIENEVEESIRLKDFSDNEDNFVIIGFNEDFLFQMNKDGAFNDFHDDFRMTSESTLQDYVQDIKDEVRTTVEAKLEPVLVVYGEVETFVEELVEDFTPTPLEDNFYQYVSNLFELN